MSAPRYLPLEVARASPHYQALVRAAISRLVVTGAFSKPEVIEGAHLEAVADAIRWDHVARIIEEETGADLLALSAGFFAHHADRGGGAVLPRRYVVIGHGKRTHGYGIADERDDGRFVVTRLKLKQAKPLPTVGRVDDDRNHTNGGGAP